MNELLVQLGLEKISPIEMIYKQPVEGNLARIPKIDQTRRLVYFVCSNDGLALKHVAKRLLSYDLCELAVKQNGLALSYVPKKFITTELCQEAVSSNGRALEYVPEEMKTLELSEIAVSYYVDMPYLRLNETYDDFIQKCQKHIAESQTQGCDLREYQKYPIAFVPKQFFTEDLFIKSITYSPLSLKDIPNKNKTKKLVSLAVSLNGLALKYVPKNYCSKSLITTAVMNNPQAIKFVPLRYITQELCNNLFQKDYSSILYIPEEFVTLQMCLKLIELKKFYVSQSMKELYDLPDDKDGNLIFFNEIPEEIRNCQQFIDEIIDKYEDGALHILDWNSNVLNERKFQKSAIGCMPQNAKGIEILPLKKKPIAYLKTKVVCIRNPKNDFELQIKKAEPYISDKNSLVVPLEPAPTNSLPVEYKLDSLIVHNLSNDENVDNIYYISDIHIEHQLFKEVKNILYKKYKASDFESNGFYEILRQTLINKIDEMIIGKKGTLLIAGDVADNIEIFSMFYEILSEKWDGTIVSILGNHELWDGTTPSDWINPEYHAREIDDIISDYKKAISHFGGCKLLENELLIKYENQQCRILSESNIMNATVKDLKEIIDKSTFTVLGGIGYSGLNEYYNSDRGLYRKAITCLDEDKRRAKRFSDVYEKVKQCAYDRQIIVLTHTPIHDWTKEECNANWIYINGHTHQNTITKEKNGATILSDNQVGYTPQKWKLNAFTPNCLWYDPFEKYDDGIYKITSAEYMAFNRGRGILSSGCNYVGTLYVLKRNNIYMFLLHSSTSLCLMAGGERKKLENNDIKYYYDNMSNYWQSLMKTMEPYKKVMLQLSDEIKKIGGIGTIHGCIIDISFVSHIYVNPYDGKITLYWALDTLSRVVYEDIRMLIKEKEPYLLKQFAAETNNHTLPLIENLWMPNYNCTKSSSMPQRVFGTEIYKPSRIMKSIQYAWEQNVIRIWNEDVLKAVDSNIKFIE